MNKRVVIKIGGKAFENKEGFSALAESFKALHNFDFIVLHGGGVEISQALQATNRNPVFVDGLRVTPKEDMEIVEEVLSQKVNRRIASCLNENGISCQRMSGKTAGLFIVEPLSRNGRNLGYVGRIKMVNSALVLSSLNNQQVPVISPVSGDEHGRSFNVNADSAAAALAVSAQCNDLIYFTDVPGVRFESEILHELTVKKAKELISSGVIKDGMIAKMESIFEALEGGVGRVHIAQWNGKDTLKHILAKKPDMGTTIQQ